MQIWHSKAAFLELKKRDAFKIQKLGICNKSRWGFSEIDSLVKLADLKIYIKTTLWMEKQNFAIRPK